MNRAMRLEEFLLCRGGEATLEEIIGQGHFSFSYKVTAAVSDLRNLLKPFSKTVVFYKGETPSKNRYVIEKISGAGAQVGETGGDHSAFHPPAPYFKKRQGHFNWGFE